MLNRILSPITQTENSFYIFTCSISSGSQPITFLWNFNSKPLVQTNDFKIESSDQFSFLKLNKLKRAHAGNYSCVAKNSDGFDSVSVYMIVKGEIILQY